MIQTQSAGGGYLLDGIDVSLIDDDGLIVTPVGTPKVCSAFVNPKLVVVRSGLTVLGMTIGVGADAETARRAA